MGKKRIEEHPKSKCRATHKTHREQTKQRRAPSLRAKKDEHKTEMPIQQPTERCRATYREDGRRERVSERREDSRRAPERREDSRRARGRRDGCRQEEVELQNAERMAAELEDAGPTHPRRKLQTKTESPHSNRISVDIMMTAWRTLVNRRHEGMLEVWAWSYSPHSCGSYQKITHPNTNKRQNPRHESLR
jgi:hypothetical protein